MKGIEVAVKKMVNYNRSIINQLATKTDLEPKFKLIQEHVNPSIRFNIHNPFLIEVQ